MSTQHNGVQGDTAWRAPSLPEAGSRLKKPVKLESIAGAARSVGRQINDRRETAAVSAFLPSSRLTSRQARIQTITHPNARLVRHASISFIFPFYCRYYYCCCRYYAVALRHLISRILQLRSLHKSNSGSQLRPALRPGISESELTGSGLIRREDLALPELALIGTRSHPDVSLASCPGPVL